MNRIRVSVGIVLVLVGGVWAAQGLDAGFVPESAMTGETTWIVLGFLGIAVGIGLIWLNRKPNGSEDLPDNDHRRGVSG